MFPAKSETMKQALLEMCFPCEMINYEPETIMISVSFMNAVSSAFHTGDYMLGYSLLSISWPRWLTSLEWAPLHNRKQQLSMCLCMCASQWSLSMWGSHRGGGVVFAWVALLINIHGFAWTVSISGGELTERSEIWLNIKGIVHLFTLMSVLTYRAPKRTWWLKKYEMGEKRYIALILHLLSKYCVAPRNFGFAHKTFAFPQNPARTCILHFLAKKKYCIHHEKYHAIYRLFYLQKLYNY